MRVVGEYPHPYFKVTLFQWNGKWIFQIEDGPIMQTYKISESEMTHEEIPGFLNQKFYEEVQEIFIKMAQAKAKALY